jgi:crotonobetainyl-CoA:carnitine CoA-transferase CaiB-like acyl-CoA transferase
MSSTAPKALAGVRVVEIGHALSAPFTTQVLGDFGAEIIKVERRGSGDLFRAVAAPFPKDAQGNKLDSSGFLGANRNKKSITVDFTKPAGQEVVRKLVAKADVLVENLKPGDLTRFGLDYAALSKVNPGLIYISVSGFGQTGPYAKRGGLDGVFQYMSGLASITGEADGPPQRVGYLVADTTTGMWGVIGVLAALYARDGVRPGHGNGPGGPAPRHKGQYIDLAMLEAMIATMGTRVEGYLATGEVPMRQGSVTGAGPSSPVTCADGQMYLSASMDTQFPGMCEAIGHPELAKDPRFSTLQGRIDNVRELLPLLDSIFVKRSVREWFELLVPKNVLCAPVYTVPQALDDPHVKERGMVTEMPHPTLGRLKVVNNPLRMSDTPASYDLPPPLLGQHTDAILREVLGMSEAEIASLKESQAV